MKPLLARLTASATVLACAEMLSACGGSDGTSAAMTPAVSTTTTTSSHATALVRLSFVVPEKTASSKSRAIKYVSSSTMSLTITVTPAGGAALSPISVSCTTTCAASFQAPVGSDSIALALTDGPNGTGNQLSLLTTNVTVAMNAANTFNLTANPVVSSVAVLLGAIPASTAGTNAGTAADIPVTVNAMDADGNTIVGPGNYVDAQGRPLTLTLTGTNVSNAGGGTVTVSQPVLSAPPATPITVHYNGLGVDRADIAVMPSRAIGGTASGATLVTNPVVTAELPTLTPASFLEQIVTGPDGNLWATEYSASKIARITPAGAVSEFPTLSANSEPQGINTGPDGKIWFTENRLDSIGRITPGGVVSEFYDGDPTSGPGTIVAGSNGAMWFNGYQTNKVERVTIDGHKLFNLVSGQRSLRIRGLS